MFGKNKETEKTEDILSEITQKRTEASPSVNFSSLIRTMKKDLMRAEKGDFSLISFEEKSKNSQVTDNKDQKEESSPFFVQSQKTSFIQTNKEEDFVSTVQQSKPQLTNVDTQSPNNVRANTYKMEAFEQSNLKPQVSQTSASRPDTSSLAYQQVNTTGSLVSNALNTPVVMQGGSVLKEEVNHSAEIEKEPLNTNIFSEKSLEQDQDRSQFIAEPLKKESQENKPADIQKLSYTELSVDSTRKGNEETSGENAMESDKSNIETEESIVIDMKRGEADSTVNMPVKDLTTPSHETETQSQKIEDRPGILNQPTFVSHGLDVKPKTLPIANTIEKQDNDGLVFDTKDQKISASNFFKENFSFVTGQKKTQSKSENSVVIPNDEFSFGMSKKSETNEVQFPIEKSISDLPSMNMETTPSAKEVSGVFQKKENVPILNIQKESIKATTQDGQRSSFEPDFTQPNSALNTINSPSDTSKQELTPAVGGAIRQDIFSPFVKKVFSYSFLLIFSILFFGGGYYAWNEFDMKVYLGLGEKKEENEIPILPPIIPEEKEEVKPVVYSPNVVNSVQTNRSSFSQDLQKIGDFTSNASVGSSFQFRFEDVNSQPLALSELFASLSHTIDVAENANWSLVASHESYGVRYGLIIATNTTAIADNVKKNLELSGSMLIKDLYEIGITLPTSYAFMSGSYNGIPVRFHNIDGAQNYSFDYIFQDSTLIIGTSKESVRSTYDASLRK